MFTPKNRPQNFAHQEQTLTNRFSLLVWNIHKENQTKEFSKHFSTLMHKNPSDILMLQEVRYPKKSDFFFEHYSFALGGNIETKENIFGVLTAAKCSFDDITRSLSTKKEFGFISRKSFLISKHQLHNAQTLYLVNIHAINFVSLKTFAFELQKIKQNILELEGPMIIGGDFNNWSKKRLKLLENFQKELCLNKLKIKAVHHVKQIFSQAIDHIYYKGITPLQAVALDTKDISDHNPIYALFEVSE